MVGCWLLSGGEEVDLMSDECLELTAKLTTAMTVGHHNPRKRKDQKEKNKKVKDRKSVV